MWLFKIFSQKHPEPFFALARELYPGQFKVWNTLYGLSITVFFGFFYHRSKKKNLYLQRHCIAWIYYIHCIYVYYCVTNWLFSPQCVTTSWSSWRTKVSWDAATHRLVKHQLAPQLTRWRFLSVYSSRFLCVCVFRISTLWSGWPASRVTI